MQVIPASPLHSRPRISVHPMQEQMILSLPPTSDVLHRRGRFFPCGQNLRQLRVPSVPASRPLPAMNVPRAGGACPGCIRPSCQPGTDSFWFRVAMLTRSSQSQVDAASHSRPASTHLWESESLRQSDQRKISKRPKTTDDKVEPCSCYCSITHGRTGEYTSCQA